MKISYGGDFETLIDDLKESGYRVDVVKDRVIIGEKVFNLVRHIKELGLTIQEVVRRSGVTRPTIMQVAKGCDGTVVGKVTRVLNSVGLKLAFSPKTVEETYYASRELPMWAQKSGLTEGTISRLVLDVNNGKLGTLKTLAQAMGISIKIEAK